MYLHCADKIRAFRYYLKEKFFLKLQFDEGGAFRSKRFLPIREGLAWQECVSELVTMVMNGFPLKTNSPADPVLVTPPKNATKTIPFSRAAPLSFSPVRVTERMLS